MRTGPSPCALCKATIESAALKLGITYARIINRNNKLLREFGEEYQTITARQAFLAVHGGPVTFFGVLDDPGYLGERTGSGVITVHQLAGTITGNNMWAMHELGHDFNANAIAPGNDYGQGYVDLRVEGIYDKNGVRIAGNTVPDSFLDDSSYVRRLDLGYQGDTFPWVQDDLFTAGEDFADMFANWNASSFTRDAAGTARSSWMSSHMANWVSLAVAHNQ